jgi:hypothetical protein
MTTQQKPRDKWIETMSEVMSETVGYSIPTDAWQWIFAEKAIPQAKALEDIGLSNKDLLKFIQWLVDERRQQTNLASDRWHEVQLLILKVKKLKKKIKRLKKN